MTVVVLTDCPPKLRGDLTKWLLEINTGVYVGTLSTRVRTELWERICDNLKTGRATMVFRAANEQRMDFWIHNTSWEPVDYDGIKLIRRPCPTLTTSSISHQSTLPDQFSNAAKRQMAHRFSEKHSPTSNQYVVIDIETTGLAAETHSIIEIAALRIKDDSIVSEFNRLILCEQSIPSEVTSLTGITDEDLIKEGIPLNEALQQFQEYIGNAPLICHNAVFEQKFLTAACKKCNLSPLRNRFIDTLSLARRKVSSVPNYKLATLAEHFSLDTSHLHRALYDCHLTHALYLKLIDL